MGPRRGLDPVNCKSRGFGGATVETGKCKYLSEYTSARFSGELGDFLVTFTCGDKEIKSKFRFVTSVVETPSLSALEFFVSFL